MYLRDNDNSGFETTPMEMITFAIKNDWMVLLPIVLCAVLMVAVMLERLIFYRQNGRNVDQFVHDMQRELAAGRLNNAITLSQEVGGLLGSVAEEGVHILAEQYESFDRQFDIAATLAARHLERGLSILGTIATVSPYLGLFGTVVRILLTFGEMSKGAGGGSAPIIMFGIGSALIATAFGLGLAICAVALNNYFHSVVNRWEDDFQLLKLLFLSYADKKTAAAPAASNAPYSRPAEI